MKTRMLLSIMLFVSTCLFSTIINVPADQPTIQEGINTAVDADTVLVQPGTYVENINYWGKNITVASLFLTTQDTTYIYSTVIDMDGYGCVVTFNSGEDSTAVLSGFTIKNGYYEPGGGIICENSSPTLKNLIITENYSQFGGGIRCQSSSPILVNVTIADNSSSTNGGGIYSSNSSPSLINVTISGNTAGFSGGGICCIGGSLSFDAVDRCNIFLNFAGSGCDLYASYCSTIDVIVDTFTVLQPDDYFAYPLDNFTFDILNAKVEQVDQDLYVSPDGSDDNSGLTVNDPLLTVNYALTKILPDSINTLTIHLSNGTYSPSVTGEIFPLYCRSYVSLLGEDEAFTILDGEGLSKILFCINDSNFSIENMTIQNGNASAGGGIYCYESSPSLNNVTITGNSAGYYGGGICCRNNSNPSLVNVTITGNSANSGGGICCISNSNPGLVNVTITGNTATDFGGGINCGYSSSPSLVNVTLSDNTANGGGGIYSYEGSSPSLVDVTISGNTSDESGGGIYCSNSSSILENVTITSNSADVSGGGIYCRSNSNLSFSVDNRGSIYSNTIGNVRGFGADIFAFECDTIHVIVDTFTVMTPTDYYVSPIDNFTFDILNCVVDDLINADVYVSVDGDDSNSGISPDLPFKTINHALEKIYADSMNINTIHLAPGVYSDFTNGEIFPIYWSNYVNLSGNSEDETILDADSTSGVMNLYGVTEAIISNITITNGSASSGGGIRCYNNSSPSLVNVTITGNSANACGGGIQCYNNSSPSLVNATITGNTASDDGGGIWCILNSNPTLVNCILWNDSPEEIYFRGVYDPNSITISYSDIQGGEAGIVTNNNGTVNWLEGNLDEDPLFVGTGGYPFSLSEDSPCIDAGNPDPIYYDPEDPGNLGYALYPAMGTVINDMGAYGGPNAIGWPVVDIEDNVIVQTPEVFLHQNYPNPFNPTTTISFSIEQNQQNEQVELAIYNLKGQKVKQLVSNSAGQHSVVWNGTDNNGKSVSSGIYFYKLKTANFEKTRKMILMK